jgi:hypothetical protein
MTSATLLQHIPHLRSAIRKTYRSIRVPEDDIEDAIQESILTALQSHTTDDLFGLMVRTATRHVGAEVHIHSYCRATDERELDTMPDRGYDACLEQLQYTKSNRRHIDYAKLDQRYRNHISTIRQQLWDLRVQHVPTAEIYRIMQRNSNWIFVTEHTLLNRYRSWLPIITQLTALDQTTITNKSDIPILNLACHGYNAQKIANMLGLTRERVASRLFSVRKRYIAIND